MCLLDENKTEVYLLRVLIEVDRRAKNYKSYPQRRTLLSEPISDESRWPPELILLREKFTAKSQLEIAQLQIKHEEEMSRLKNDHQKQLDRKIKRHTDFDNGRSLEKTESERDNLRELCNTFRHLLYELAKCVSVCESDLNASLVDELNKHGILQPSIVSPTKLRPDSPSIEPDLNESDCPSIDNRRFSLVPDVSGILSLIEDPSLLNFVNDTDTLNSTTNNFNLNECLEKLKIEADSLLGLSEKMIQKRITDNKEFDEAQKSLEEEDGLKIAKDDFNLENANQKPRLSLPNFFMFDKQTDSQRKLLSHSNLNDLKNRLLLAETKNQELEKKLAESLAQQQELTQKLNTYLDSQSEELSEGYGISQLRSPQRHQPNKPVTSFTALQERAKQYFNDTSTSDVSQLLEDFCRECDRHVDEEKDKMKDLQEQSDLLRQQVQDLEAELNENKKTNSGLKADLKESIEKIYDLREIIVGLEKQVKEKDNIVKSLECDIDCQKTTNESLQTEMKCLLSQSEVAPTYEEKILQLEEQLESLQPNADQAAAIERIASHLRDIEDNLDRKINTLESIHVGAGTVTACSSPSEDVSIRGSGNNLDAVISPRNFKYLAKDPSFPVDQIMRIIDKMQKHSKVEEAAIKLVRDLEMQIKALHTSYMELQNERDLLKEKMDEQLMRITSIQSRLDEQRQRAEELQRAGTSDLNLKLYDLQAEVNALKETVTTRDKQISVLKSHLAQSKEIIDKQEAEIASYNSITDGNDTYSKLFVEKLEARIATKDLENKNLRDKMRTEMITKVALPDLMETMLADKTEEIEYLKEQLEARESELKTLRDSQIFTKAEEKISELFTKNTTNDIIDNDYIRKLPDSGTRLSLNPVKVFSNNENTPPLKPRQINFTSKLTNDMNSIQTPLFLSSQFSNVSKNDSLDSDSESKAQLKEEIEYLKLSLEDKTKLVDEVTTESKKLKDEFEAEKAILYKEIETLRGQIDELQSKVETIEAELVLGTKNYDKKCSEFELINGQLHEERANNGVMKQQLNSMENTIKLKDELISKQQSDIETCIENEKTHLDTINRLKREQSELVNLDDCKETNYAMENRQLREELSVVKGMLTDAEQELSEKMIDYEKCLLDLKEQEKKIFHLTDVLTDSKTARSVENLRIEIRNQHDENDRLKREIEELKQRLSVERSTSLEAGIDEIASRVEKELNYSAQLDSSILKAMGKDDVDSDNENENDDEIELIRTENNELVKAIEKIRSSLDSERQKFAYIHQQDAKCIEEMTKRLEAAIEGENELNKLLEEERNKTSKLSTKMLEHQFERAKLSASNLSLNESPISSPRRMQKGSESDQELLKCQNDEIRLLKSQLEREKERAADIDKSLAREKNRFEKELSEQKAYGDRMKDELERIIRENKTLQEELDDAQEKVTLSTREIDNLQTRIKQLQDADTYRNARSEKDRNELAQSIVTCRELKTRLINMERERDVLQERVSILQADIDRGAQREARLTESLVAGYQQSNVISGGLLPQQLLAKLKEMNDNLGENVRENRQLSETLQMLTEERHVLQKKVNDLEMICIDRDDLEERANHLFGKYLRTESFRRALIHQKRYLMIVLNTYECNEAKVLNALNGDAVIQRKRRVPSFKSVALTAVAIERMKFILRRWQTGKRVCAKNSIFPHNTPPRRTHSASTINWTRNGTDAQIPNPLHHPQSPPIRERPMTSVLKGRRCTNNDFTNQI